MCKSMVSDIHLNSEEPKRMINLLSLYFEDIIFRNISPIFIVLISEIFKKLSSMTQDVR